MKEPFSKGFSWHMGDKFWEANLLRACSAWGINDEIIMPRAEDFSLHGNASHKKGLQFYWGRGWAGVLNICNTAVLKLCYWVV